MSICPAQERNWYQASPFTLAFENLSLMKPWMPGMALMMSLMGFSSSARALRERRLGGGDGAMLTDAEDLAMFLHRLRVVEDRVVRGHDDDGVLHQG